MIIEKEEKEKNAKKEKKQEKEVAAGMRIPKKTLLLNVYYYHS